MLLLGVHKHGLGNWEKLREDEDLGLTNKIAESTAEETEKPKVT